MRKSFGKLSSSKKGFHIISYISTGKETAVSAEILELGTNC